MAKDKTSKLDQLRLLREGHFSRRTSGRSASAPVVGALSSNSLSIPVATRSPVASIAISIGRPRLGQEKSTLKATEPWKAQGMSRRTWFRRQAEKRRKTDGEG